VILINTAAYAKKVRPAAFCSAATQPCAGTVRLQARWYGGTGCIAAGMALAGAGAAPTGGAALPRSERAFCRQAALRTPVQ
jgi:hypothetical protein